VEVFYGPHYDEQMPLVLTATKAFRTLVYDSYALAQQDRLRWGLLL
jgi:hypothetical protein